MIRFIDVSSYQEGINIPSLSIGACIVKSTGGKSYVQSTCDPIVQQCRENDIPWGFYHFGNDDGKSSTAKSEADWFITNCLNYFGEGIPVLDWERNTMTVAWVNEFVRYVHSETKVWPWIYGNPWRFNQGGVEPNCMRWTAQYPGITTFDQAENSTPQAADQPIGAWQFTSSGQLKGWGGNLDLNLFYGDANAWKAYARGEREDNPTPVVTVLENGRYKVTIEEKA